MSKVIRITDFLRQKHAELRVLEIVRGDQIAASMAYEIARLYERHKGPIAVLWSDEEQIIRNAERARA